MDYNLLRNQSNAFVFPFSKIKLVSKLTTDNKRQALTDVCFLVDTSSIIIEQQSDRVLIGYHANTEKPHRKLITYNLQNYPLNFLSVDRAFV